ncbi:methyltransferase domain-containing protein [Synechococcus sp. PCC 7336]|uniref:methyltransferase domain-containing protein n=1 Tax=Synechococcus sp. PCC 7336 TaxID=195250 RepID=UPI000349948A|nr:methyltransferase domain-containing protein [Synechococcus sp. PCC 7336]
MSDFHGDRTALNQRIGRFYDRSSALWEEVWGEHMHHGYYEPEQPRPNRRQAQIDLLDRLIDWSQLSTVDRLLDVGCGIGGSSLYLAERFGAQATGITLSPVQAGRAQERAVQAQLADRTSFQVADALAMPFADGSFDLVWSLESGEHMPDKQRFLSECCRVLAPGGQLIVATWCHREGALTAAEQQHLAQIYDVYCLPYVVSLGEYEAIARSFPLDSLRSADWSAEVAPFWDLVMDSAKDLRVLLKVLTAGWSTVRATLALRLMSQGYARGLIKFGLLTGTKAIAGD